MNLLKNNFFFNSIQTFPQYLPFKFKFSFNSNFITINVSKWYIVSIIRWKWIKWASRLTLITSKGIINHSYLKNPFSHASFNFNFKLHHLLAIQNLPSSVPFLSQIAPNSFSTLELYRLNPQPGAARVGY